MEAVSRLQCPWQFVRPTLRTAHLVERNIKWLGYFLLFRPFHVCERHELCQDHLCIEKGDGLGHFRHTDLARQESVYDEEAREQSDVHRPENGMLQSFGFVETLGITFLVCCRLQADIRRFDEIGAQQSKARNSDKYVVRRPSHNPTTVRKLGLFWNVMLKLAYNGIRTLLLPFARLT